MLTDLVGAIIAIYWAVAMITWALAYFGKKMPIEQCIVGALLWPISALAVWNDRRNGRGRWR
ncbi:MAG: hypothetical protein DRJ03_29785 [Chloroflexi bacterium]|nr:MAG: hypothetical protein DRJ03_29785 [Chloroflexota bacterium]